MKGMIFSILFLGSALALSGCASSGGGSSNTAGVDLKKYVPKPMIDKVPPPPTEESVKQYGRLMTGKEIKDTLSGKIVSGTTTYKQFGMNGYPFAQLYKADGTFICRSSGMDDEGTWWVEGDQLCLHFVFFHKEPKICTHVRIDKDGKMTDYNDKRISDIFWVAKDQ